MIAGNAFYGCFYRHGRTVTYVYDSGSQRRAPPFVQSDSVYETRVCASLYMYAVALTRLKLLAFSRRTHSHSYSSIIQ